ncbi:MAG: 4-hydroxy-tetrahydrodipicolinate synthase [Methanosarcinales archaeon]
MKFEGVYAPIPTPFHSNGEINYEVLKSHIQYLISEKLNGIVALGTSGEFPMLTFEERKKVVEVIMDEVKGKTQVIVGTGSPSTNFVKDLSLHAIDSGADAVLVVTPYYLKTSEEGLLKHYRELFSVIDAPILAYNIPSFTGVDISVDLVKELAEEGILAGIKDTSGNLTKVYNYIKKTPQSFSVLVGSDAIFTASVLHGGSGGIIGTSNVFPSKTVQMYHALKNGDIKTALQIQMELMDIIDLIGLGTFPAALKYMISLKMDYPTFVRSPLVELTQMEKKMVDDAMNLLLEKWNI